MKKIVIGILAHVDAGKTTLSEAMLYKSGQIRELGRVDKGSTFLDTYALEKERGITIFSKQALLEISDMQITLLDTPGHVDFSAEMERTLQVLDYAILVISATDGVQGHTHTLWKLLQKYQIPVFLFINKMDREEAKRDKIVEELQDKLSNSCIDFSQADNRLFFENIAMQEEKALDHFLEEGILLETEIQSLIQKRKVFPCFFGSALKADGVENFLKGIQKYTVDKYRIQESKAPHFAAKVFKVTRDEKGNRLTHIKMLEGILKVKDSIGEAGEKVNQIRIYSGEKYYQVEAATAGGIYALTGLSNTNPGDGLGAEEDSRMPVLEPVLRYRMILQDGVEAAIVLPQLRKLEEEDPLLAISFEEELQEIQIKLMGEIQMEILKTVICERFQLEVEFDEGNIVYKETIKGSVEGVGHFEPLRHYAEVHLLLEEGERGSGLSIQSNCSEDSLPRNWQRLILTHLAEKEHKGALVGGFLTDMKITLVAGAAHNKHTEGGDFRQATYRAVRQGVRSAENILLEPYYTFFLEVPEEMTGRAMTDIDRMYGRLEIPQKEGEMTVLTGSIPASTIRGYQKEVISYTRGRGRLLCTFSNYDSCHNTEEIVQKLAYDVDKDMENTADSVFCAHGSGFVVPWHKVSEYMHIPFQKKEYEIKEAEKVIKKQSERVSDAIGEEEVEDILSRTFYANKRDKENLKRGIRLRKVETTILNHTKVNPPKKIVEQYFLIDGYNIIYAWEDLKELAQDNMDGARGKLLDVMCHYQAMKGCQLLVVFDAYRVKGRKAETFVYQNIKVVYTKEGETADQYIERFAYENAQKYHMTVATSDYMEQIITSGSGCSILSARQLREDLELQEQLLCELKEHML